MIGANNGLIIHLIQKNKKLKIEEIRLIVNGDAGIYCLQ